MCRPLHQPDGPLSAGPTASRRTVLRAAGLTGAATAAAGLGLTAATTAVALPRQNTADNVASWRPDPDSPRFTLVVMPDTQYLFDGASIHTEPVEASLRYILDHGRDENIVFLSHLGDLTEHGLADEFGPLSEAFRLLDRRRVGYSVLAGNHDIDSRTDDQRGRTSYLDAFGPQRLRRLPTFGGATPDGYNTYHLFRAAGREWLVLALDWRPSAGSFAWARDVIKKHPKTPVILTTHEIVYADQYGDEADFAPHGKRLWDELIADNDQIFDDVLVLANHPLRLGIDSPHEMRAWRDAAPGIMIGMEGAPGAQAGAFPGWAGPNSIRGEYVNKPSENSWPGYPAAAYVTYGGFDWATATVGGLWDSMLAEGRLFSITSNSDVHRVAYDTWKNGDWLPGQNFDNTGRLPDPVNTTQPQPGGDFWPGQFSRTHVGVTRYGYRQVMAGMRAGRVWVDHGQLIDGIDVRVNREHGIGRGATLGGRLRVRRGEKIVLNGTVTTASRPNHHGEVPRLAHLDVIRGAVRGPVADRDEWRAPDTRVVHTADVEGRTGRYTLRIPVGRAEESFYLRLRGSDGKRNAPGFLGAAIDPHGPIPHEPGNGDPWLDTWCYTNPVFVDVVR
ncbi:hypothetical protein AB0F96_30830 [Streptomyces sp. NPDC023998]|uniref:hypothetical protein n=1 Tax=Streptomyces sp. NPDC023998 TaxID=3154597 RepID=UPI0033FBB43E